MLGGYFYLYRDISTFALVNLGWAEAIVIFLTIGGQIGARVWCDRILYTSLGYSVPAGSLYVIQAKQTILNYLPFKAGTIYAACALKMRHQIAVSHFTAVFATQNALTLGVTLLAAALAMSWSTTAEVQSWPVVTVLAALGLLSLAVLFLRIPTFIKLPERLQNVVKRIHEGMLQFRRKPDRLLATTLLRLVAVILMAWRFQLLYTVAGESVTFAVALVISASVLVSLLIAITPAGLGIREALLGVTSGLLAAPPAVAVIASMLERILVLGYVGTVVAGHSLLGRNTQ